MLKTTSLFALIGMMIVSVFLATTSANAASKAIYPNPIEPAPSPSMNLGKMNYDAKCASCHGKTGRGTDKGPTFISRIYHPGHHGDGAFYIAAKRGTRAHHWRFGNMKPVPGVTDSMIKSIVEYVRAVQKANGLF
jgi:cytochrome c553